MSSKDEKHLKRHNLKILWINITELILARRLMENLGRRGSRHRLLTYGGCSMDPISTRDA